MRDDEFEWDDRKANRNERQHGSMTRMPSIGSISMNLTRTVN
jgi:uncharacterized DUF497 family protein